MSTQWRGAVTGALITEVESIKKKIDTLQPGDVLPATTDQVVNQSEVEGQTTTQALNIVKTTALQSQVAVGQESAARKSALAALAVSISKEIENRQEADDLLAPKFSPTFTGAPRAPTPPAKNGSTRLATTEYVDDAVAEVEAAALSDLELLAPLNSPALAGTPTAPTAAPGTASAQVASTAFVAAAVAAVPSSKWGAIGGTLDEQSDLVDALAAKAPSASPAFTGTPTAPTPLAGKGGSQVATGKYVDDAVALEEAARVAGDGAEAVARGAAIATAIAPLASISALAGETLARQTADAALQGSVDSKAPLASPVFSGTPTGPTAGAGNSSTQLATTAFVTAAVQSAPKTAWGQVTGALTAQTDLRTALDEKAPIVSPAFSGTPTAPTATVGTSTTQLATTAFVAAATAPLATAASVTAESNARAAAVALLAPLASPALTGTPIAPTPPAADSSTRVATTAFVGAAVAALAATEVTGYTSAGLTSLRLWVGQTTTDANGDFAIDYSSAGFTTLRNIQTQAVVNTTAVVDMPSATVRTATSTVAAGTVLRGANVNSGGGASVRRAGSGVVVYVEVTGS